MAFSGILTKSQCIHTKLSTLGNLNKNYGLVRNTCLVTQSVQKRYIETVRIGCASGFWGDTPTSGKILYFEGS